MALLSKGSPILLRNSCRPGCIQTDIRLCELLCMTLRNFTVTTGLCRGIRKTWNLRSATGSRAVSKVPFRISATWLIPDPDKLAPEKLIRRFPRLDSELHVFLRNVVFLVTPAFAKWFGADGAFLGAALQHIYGNFTYRAGMRNIQSSVAIVDRLPSPAGVNDHPEAIPSSEKIMRIHGHEGIALWIDSMKFDLDILPSPSNEDLVQRLVRVLSMRRLGSATAVELRPANTLFVNGHQNTIFQDSWAITPSIDPKLKQTSPRQALKTLEIFNEADTPKFYAPVEALTRRREVVSSMGNIIRQLKSQESGAAIPASAELEEKVPQYLARRRGTDGTLAVFALVLPQEILETIKQDGLVSPSEGNVTETDLFLLRRALLEGAHLHRITSGGGGWGKKQGLLSLDPSFDFGKHEDTGSLDAILDGAGPGSSADSMNAVNPGDFVQFFASYESEQQVRQNLVRDVDTTNWDARKWMEPAHLQTVLGSLPPQDNFLLRSQDGEQFGSHIIGMPGIFGMLSAGGTCLRRYKLDQSEMRLHPNADEVGEGRGKLMQVALSRMDIPYGFWNAQSANQGLPPGVRRIPATAMSGEQQSL